MVDLLITNVKMRRMDRVALSSYSLRLPVANLGPLHSPEIRPILRLHLLLCRSQKEENLKNIFVGNLSFGATEDALRTMFEAHGTVDRVNLVTDRETGRARGFGFVEMSNNGMRARNCGSQWPRTRWSRAQY
jgi:hypothetical protein